MALRGIHVYTVGQHRGKNRIWLESLSLNEANFVPGTPVIVEYGHEIIIKQANEEDAMQHISSRKRGSREIPILDLSRGVDPYFGYKEKVRVEIHQNEIRITKLQSFQIIDESDREVEVPGCEKFRIVEFPSGAGLGGIAFESTGLYDVVAAGDLDMEALEALRFNQPNPILYYGNMYDIHQDDLPTGDVFMFTPDCRSYARLGRKDYVCSLSAPMAHHGIRFIQRHRFPVVVTENVPEFGDSVWYRHFKEMMEIMGYNVVEKVLQAWDFGTIATRPRFISVATVKPYTFEFPVPELNTAHRDKAKHFLRDVEDRKWLSITESKTLSFFFGKHRDEQKAKGNGFGISESSLVTLDHQKIPAFIASYHKIQSSGPFLKHPKNPDLLSMFEPGEILSIQGFPEYEMPPWLALSTQYKLIGQAICGRMFRSLATSIATILMKIKLGARSAMAKMARPIRPVRRATGSQQLTLQFG